MIRSPRLQLTQPVRTLWRASLGLLLLCGFITWAGAVSRGANGLVTPFLADQVEQLVFAGGGEHFRVRPSVRGDGFIAGSNDNDNPDEPSEAFLTAISPSNSGSSTSSYPFPTSTHLPNPNRYQLPASREPPKA